MRYSCGYGCLLYIANALHIDRTILQGYKLAEELSFYDFKQAADLLCLKGNAYVFDKMSEVPANSILYLQFYKWRHFVVFKEAKEKWVYYYEPFKGERRIPFWLLRFVFLGHVFVFEGMKEEITSSG